MSGSADDASSESSTELQILSFKPVEPDNDNTNPELPTDFVNSEPGSLRDGDVGSSETHKNSNSKHRFDTDERKSELGDNGTDTKIKHHTDVDENEPNHLTDSETKESELPKDEPHPDEGNTDDNTEMPSGEDAGDIHGDLKEDEFDENGDVVIANTGEGFGALGLARKRFTTLETIDEIGLARFCGLCDDSSPAEGRCLDCSEDLCSNCINYHAKLRVTSEHNVLSFEPGATSDIVVPARSSVTCSKHGEPYKFFCKLCTVAVCRDCMLTLHKDHQAADLTDELGSAKQEVERLLKRVQNSIRVTEREVGELRSYQNEFLEKVQNVTDVVDKLHNAVLQRVEKSHQELTKIIKATKNEEIGRMEHLENFYQQRLLSASDFIAVADHVLASQDGIEVMVKLEMLRQSVSPICYNADIQKGHAEFFLAKNQRFTGNTAENILGRVAFSVMSPPVGGSNENKTFIKEIRLKRQVAFHIWEMHCTKPSVRGVVEAANGLIWVATPRSLLIVSDDGSRKNSAHLASDVANIAGGPGGALLVSFDKGNTIRVLSQDNLAFFVSVPHPIDSMAGGADGQRVLVPQITKESAKLLVVCNNGKDIVKVDLPDHLADAYIPSLAVSPDGEVALCISKSGRVILLTSSFDYKTDYHGPDGVLYPRSVCYDKLGHLIVADSKRCTVQLVSKDGFFLSYLLNKEDFQDIGSPTSVTVDSRDRLWIGTANGNVCAYTYMHDVM